MVPNPLITEFSLIPMKELANYIPDPRLTMLHRIIINHDPKCGNGQGLKCELLRCGASLCRFRRVQHFPEDSETC